MARQYWLMKSEPKVYSFDDLMAEPECTDYWDGVRNYQARNFMRDRMQVGDRVLFYHSNTKPPHVAGIAEVASEAYPDHTAWDPDSDHPDPKSTPDNPRWYMVDVKGLKPLQRRVSIGEIRENPNLADMKLVQKGQRLSIQPLTREQYLEVLRMAETGDVD